MGYAYIALADSGTPNRSIERLAEVASREMGMQSVTTGPITLYISKETPVHHLGEGAILIGHAFHRSGGLVNDGARLPARSSHAQLRKYLIDNCWGDYLLVQPRASGEHESAFMRDPSGGISCVYAFQREGGFITSDISIATRLGLYRKRIDWDFIPHYLTYPNVKTRRTGLADVHELLPGCTLLDRGTGISVAQEWCPWRFVTQDMRHSDPREAAEDVLNTVAGVVRAWAETDESVLLELSGGLDSSIVAACLRGTNARVTCCTLVTPVPGADERRYARLMADHLGVPLRSRELTFEEARFDFALPPNSVHPRTAALQYAVNEQMDAAGDHYGPTSFFSGGGGDTVFCYLNGATPAVDALKERGLQAGLAAIGDLSELHQCTFWKATRFAIRKLLRGPKAPYKANASFLAPLGIASTAEDHPWFAAPSNTLPGDRERIVDLAGTQAFRDSIPRAAKRSFRMPLLSQPVVEACLRVPTWMWIIGGRNRAIARVAFAELLPKEILERRSKGTFVSYTGGAYRRSKDRIRHFLLSGHLQAKGMLDDNALTSFFQRDLAPRDQSFMRMFELCMVENWIRNQT